MNLEMLFWLLTGHAIADFALQSDVMAKGKNRHNKATPPPGNKYSPCWPYWLSAHALIHGAMAALATGYVAIGISETAIHWLTDFLKCENKFGPHFDQICHIATKILWWVIVINIPTT